MMKIVSVCDWALRVFFLMIELDGHFLMTAHVANASLMLEYDGRLVFIVLIEHAEQFFLFDEWAW